MPRTIDTPSAPVLKARRFGLEDGDTIQKHYSFEVKAVSEDGIIEGYASVTGNVDSDNEVIDAGAFDECLEQTKGVWPVLFAHNVLDPRGWNLSAHTDEIGLYIRSKLLLNTEDGRKAYEYCKLGLEVGGNVGLSIGFRARVADVYMQDGIRHFAKVFVREHSICVFQSNTQASVTGAKSDTPERKPAMELSRFKAADFDAALQEAKDMQALNEERWQMDRALYDVVHETLKAEDLTPAEKKTAINESFVQYGAAMGAWYGRYIDVQMAADGNTSDDDDLDGSMAEKTTPAGVIDEAKSEKIKATAKNCADRMKMAKQHLDNANNSVKQAYNCMEKSAKEMRAIHQGRYDENDTNTSTTGKSESEDFDLWLKALETESAKIVTSAK